jgi:hypothetical protein
MAEPITLPFSGYLVLLGNGATPEVFTAPCGFIKKALKFSAASSDTIVPDCDNPALPAWTLRNITSLSAQISGSGVLAMENLALWTNWLLSGADKNVQVQKNLPGAQGGGYWQGAALLTDFSEDVDLKSEGGRTQQAVTIDSDGPWFWTPNP